jgi:hypothetical protein
MARSARRNLPVAHGPVCLGALRKEVGQTDVCRYGAFGLAEPPLTASAPSCAIHLRLFLLGKEKPLTLVVDSDDFNDILRGCRMTVLRRTKLV